MFSIFCCKRKSLKIPNTKKEIKLDLNINKNKDAQSIEVNQSQSLSMISNNLNNSTKDNILQKQNKFNIVNDNKFENIQKNITDSVKNVVYNIINVDNIINNKKFFGVKERNNINNKIKFELNRNKEKISLENLNEREKKLFENEKELSNNENRINNKIMEIINLNKKLNAEKRKASQRNNIINDVIKLKKITSEKENKNEIKTNNNINK